MACINPIMKQLKFDHNFAEAIQTGEKTETFRVNDDKDIKQGDLIQLVDKVDGDRPATWIITGELSIISVFETPLGSLSEEHIMRVDSFSSIEEMIQTFRRFYGEYVDEKTLIKVLVFEYFAYDKPIKFLDNIDKLNNEVLLQAKLYADGGSRGNPGPSALGFVVKDATSSVVHSDSKYLGVTTNNQAEYHALIAGLEWCLKRGVREVDVFLDSMLVVNQLRGVYKVKNRDLWTLYETAKKLTSKFRRVSYTHIPRELNKLADSEVNKALDAVKDADVVQ